MPLVACQTITSFDAPELAPYRNMKRQVEANGQGIFVAEGDKVVQRLLASPLTVRSVLVPTTQAETYAALIAARPEPIQLFTAPLPTLEQLTGFNLYQGILAVALIPAPSPLDHLLVQAPANRLLVAADGLSNADNVGGLIRNAAAFGAHGLILGETCISPYLRRAVRISMGAIFKTPHHVSANLAATLSELRQSGVRSVAAHPHTSRVLTHADLTGPRCLVFGSEGHGLRPETLAACDEVVAIPMAPEIDSLNVMNASAVFLYEACRQRGDRLGPAQAP